MSDAVLSPAESVLNALRELDDSYVEDGVSNHYISFQVKPDECVLAANEAGLVHAARQMLELAFAPDDSHRHFDEAGMVDECDRPLVATRRAAPWDR